MPIISSCIPRIQSGLVSMRLRNRSLFDRFPTRSATAVRWNSNHHSPFNKWVGSSPRDHAVPRVKRGDETDPETEAAGKGMKDREENYGTAKADLPDGVTERQGLSFARKAKQQFPEAPEPIIGENDEIGRVRYTNSWNLDLSLLIITSL